MKTEGSQRGSGRGAGPRRPGGVLVAAALAALALPGAAPALDLVEALPHLLEARFVRSGVRPSPGPQTFRFLRVRRDPAGWPARLAADRARRLRKRGRRVSRWSGMLQGYPAWGIDTQVLTDSGRLRRIRTRFEVWSPGPARFLMHMRADDPGGEGRRRAQQRAGHLLRAFQQMARGQNRDPFREVRLGPETGEWHERYALALPGGLRAVVRVGGEPPQRPPETRPHDLWGYTGYVTGPGAPRALFRVELPGLVLETRPGPPTGEARERLWRMLGVNEGVFMPAGPALAEVSNVYPGEQPRAPSRDERLGTDLGDLEGALDEVDGDLGGLADDGLEGDEFEDLDLLDGDL